MREFVVQQQEAGRRLDRFVCKQFPGMPRSFLYKMLRGNGFRLNGRRVHHGDILLNEGDLLQIYLNEEQVMDFEASSKVPVSSGQADGLKILFENEDLIAFDKPPGMLSQKSTNDDLSLSELGAEYLYAHGLTVSRGFVPGVINRLDRMTSGVVLMGKNLRAQQSLNEMIQKDMIDKFYLAIVSGHPCWNQSFLIHDAKKIHKDNRLMVSEKGQGGIRLKSAAQDLQYNETADLTLVQIQLMTGKSHQIRAQLSYEGFPILGDEKYHGSGKLPDGTHLRRQMLLAHRLCFRQTLPPLAYLTGLQITADPPQDMQRVINQYFERD